MWEVAGLIGRERAEGRVGIPHACGEVVLGGRWHGEGLLHVCRQGGGAARCQWLRLPLLLKKTFPGRNFGCDGRWVGSEQWVHH